MRGAAAQDRVFELISVGNELLIGKILNTNAQWLAKEVLKLGGYLRRCTTVRDDVDEIALAISESLQRGTAWLVVGGGLGPTFDDMTLKGVAKALGLRLEVNDDAIRLIKKYLGSETGLSDLKLKMATLPEGSTPLENPVGVAPGVMLRSRGTTIFCLPGVPGELKGIFSQEVAVRISKRLGSSYWGEKTLRVYGCGEEMIAPLLVKVMKDHPSVYVKSHPKGRHLLELHLQSVQDSQEAADTEVGQAADELKALVTSQLKVRVEEG